MKSSFNGCFVATLTPFDKQDRVDTGVVISHAQWLIDEGIEGLCPTGTTGEFLFLSEAEKSEIIRATVEAAKSRVPVIAGIWGLREEETLRLAKSAEDSGADGLFLPPPIYYPADDSTIFQYYSAIRKASSLPLYAYNIPQYAANEVSINSLNRLFAEGVIAGVKDSTGNVERVAALVREFGSVGTVFAASDGFVSKGKQLGADGFISAMGNIAPSLFAKLWAGEFSLQEEVTRLRSELKQYGSIAALKCILGAKGFPFGESRLPYSKLSESAIKSLTEFKI